MLVKKNNIQGYWSLHVGSFWKLFTAAGSTFNMSRYKVHNVPSKIFRDL